MKSNNPTIKKVIEQIEALPVSPTSPINYEVTNENDSQYTWDGITSLTGLAYRKLQEANPNLAGAIIERKFIMKATDPKGTMYTEVVLDIEGLLGPLSEDNDRYVSVKQVKALVEEEVNRILEQRKWKLWKSSK